MAEVTDSGQGPVAHWLNLNSGRGYSGAADEPSGAQQHSDGIYPSRRASPNPAHISVPAPSSTPNIQR